MSKDPITQLEYDIKTLIARHDSLVQASTDQFSHFDKIQATRAKIRQATEKYNKLRQEIWDENDLHALSNI